MFEQFAVLFAVKAHRVDTAVNLIAQLCVFVGVFARYGADICTQQRKHIASCERAVGDFRFFIAQAVVALHGVAVKEFEVFKDFLGALRIRIHRRIGRDERRHTARIVWDCQRVGVVFVLCVIGKAIFVPCAAGK